MEPSNYKTLKKEFFKRSFLWSDDIRDFPGDYVFNCIKNEKVNYKTIFEWLNEYITNKDENLITGFYYKCFRILSIYNVGLSKESVLTIYHYIMCEINKLCNYDYILLSKCLFYYKKNDLNFDQISGLIPYLKYFGLDDEFKKTCLIYENIINNISFEDEKNSCYKELINNYISTNNETLINEKIKENFDKFSNECANAKINDVKNTYSKYKKYIDSIRNNKSYKHILKSYDLLGIEYSFNMKRLYTDIDNSTCKLYADD